MHYTHILTLPRGKWAVCSGSIDPGDATPEAAARREIEEETQLTSADISLFRVGKPFHLCDAELQVDWTIHPFAFQLNDPDKPIVIEGEHTEYKFVAPSSISSYDTVPALDVSTRRVLPGPTTEAALASLRADHSSGAEVLATRAVTALRDLIHSDDLAAATTPQAFWDDLRLAAWTLAKNGRPSMGPAIEAALFAALDRIALDVSLAGGNCFTPTGLDGLALDEFKQLASNAVDASLAGRNLRVAALAVTFTTLVQRSAAYQTAAPLTLLTLSFSSSVAACLAHLARAAAAMATPVHILVLESRPRFEGVALAKELLASLDGAATIEILTDASVGMAVQRADFLVLGADKLAANGAVSNKIGSLPAAVLAKTLQPQCQVVVVSGTDKIVDASSSGSTGAGAGDEGEVEKNDTREVTEGWPQHWAVEVRDAEDGAGGKAKVEVRNTYFEWVPARFVDVYVTEIGEMDGEGVGGVARGKGKLEERLFRDL